LRIWVVLTIAQLREDLAFEMYFLKKLYIHLSIYIFSEAALPVLFVLIIHVVAFIPGFFCRVVFILGWREYISRPMI